MPEPPRPPSGAWTSASELAEYAYCPRAWWYRAHPPLEGPTQESRRSAQAGARYHDRALSTERRRDRHRLAAAGLLAIALGLVVVGVVGVLR